MKDIYVLTQGEYADYMIVGIYSTKELAEEAQSKYEFSEWTQIETYPLNEMVQDSREVNKWWVKWPELKNNIMTPVEVSQ